MPDRKEGGIQESIQVLSGAPALLHQLLFQLHLPQPCFLGGHVCPVRREMKEEMLCWQSVITLVNWVIHHLKTV